MLFVCELLKHFYSSFPLFDRKLSLMSFIKLIINMITIKFLEIWMELMHLWVEILLYNFLILIELFMHWRTFILRQHHNIVNDLANCFNAGHWDWFLLLMFNKTWWRIIFDWAEINCKNFIWLDIWYFLLAFTYFRFQNWFLKLFNFTKLVNFMIIAWRDTDSLIARNTLVIQRFVVFHLVNSFLLLEILSLWFNCFVHNLIYFIVDVSLIRNIYIFPILC